MYGNRTFKTFSPRRGPSRCHSPLAASTGAPLAGVPSADATACSASACSGERHARIKVGVSQGRARADAAFLLHRCYCAYLRLRALRARAPAVPYHRRPAGLHALRGPCFRVVGAVVATEDLRLHLCAALDADVIIRAVLAGVPCVFSLWAQPQQV